ncbi:unnamed protein product [Cladocopium goreaui]|uniref:Uncharacterized protein n=1 Tax=Cladocopium goreaui TaxID=2562237 RepID=A0A9P1C022_9DINO|nr:unnamed protein product [Cladocopium goreaui]
MWSWFSGTVPKVPQAPQAPKPERCSGDWRRRQYQLPPKMLCARAPRWPCPEVPSSYFREACYKQLPSPGQWICSCSLANMFGGRLLSWVWGQVPCTLREGPGSSGARRRALEAGRSGTTGARPVWATDGG